MARVTDHTYASSPSSATMFRPEPLFSARPLSSAFPAAITRRLSSRDDRQVVVCHFCGRRGRFINPFRDLE